MEIILELKNPLPLHLLPDEAKEKYLIHGFLFLPKIKLFSDTVKSEILRHTHFKNNYNFMHPGQLTHLLSIDEMYGMWVYVYV